MPAHDAVLRCNCESASCDHEPAACIRAADPAKRLMYVGAVCAVCHDRTPMQYRLPSKPSK